MLWISRYAAPLLEFKSYVPAVGCMPLIGGG